MSSEGGVTTAEGDMPLSEGNILPSVGGVMTAEGGMPLSQGGILPSGAAFHIWRAAYYLLSAA